MTDIRKTARYQKARKEWADELPPRPQCWLCLGYIDRTLPARSRMSLTADHEYPVANNPDLACDKRYFRPAHLVCNSSRSARGWTPEEFRENSTLMLTNNISSTPVAEPVVVDSMQLVIDHMNRKREPESVRATVPESVPDVVDNPIASKSYDNSNSFSTNRKVNSIKSDPRPEMQSRNWNCDHPNTMLTKNCSNCMTFRSERIKAIREWESRHPEYLRS
ncbi:hypothetical protein [Rhodococcoides fascians]|uniref:hypothetical protein n=1 Tax=Rhodococcoides fascians TaxID=1828 RepID=UPI00056A8344|nr:hypothetical protein [Rhodococcus fascians]